MSLIMPHPPPNVFVENLSDKEGLVLSLTFWTSPQGAGVVERNIIEQIKRSLGALGENFKALRIMRQRLAPWLDTGASR